VADVPLRDGASVAREQSWIVMMGDDFSAPGGIATVVRHYRDHGLFASWPLLYVPTYVGTGVMARLWHALRALLRLLGALLAGRVLLLHVHCASRGSFWRKAFYCALARAFRRPYIVHLHGGEFPEFFSRECGAFGQSIVRTTMTRAASVVALTAKWESWLRETFPGAAVVRIGNPVTVPAMSPEIRARGRTVLYLGRMYPEKGVLELIAAASEVRRAVPDVRFVLAGSATDKFMTEMTALVANLGLGGNVEFPGWVTGGSKDRLLAECDIFVLPSYAEGLPLGLLEAMVAGRAVVTTPVGGIPDVVKDGVSGILVPPRDAQALASALISLLQDASRRTSLGVEARKRVVEFYSDHVVFAQIGELYAKCGVNPARYADSGAAPLPHGSDQGCTL